jgi:hypothetical protein
VALGATGRLGVGLGLAAAEGGGLTLAGALRLVELLPQLLQVPLQLGTRLLQFGDPVVAGLAARAGRGWRPPAHAVEVPAPCLPGKTSSVHFTVTMYFALCCLTRRSSIMSLAFPRRAAHYDRYLTFRGAPPGEVAAWKAALQWFVQKLSLKYGRPLLLKSPGHTCRIKMLLELFPGAKFVHIYRDPYAVFLSTRHMMRKAWPWWCLQRPDERNLDDRIVSQYKEVFEVFFEERGLIPPGHLHEVCFEELEKEPIGQLRRLYERLDLPDFAPVEPALREYLRSLAGYQKNTFPELSAEVRERLAREWRRCFEEWKYPT